MGVPLVPPFRIAVQPTKLQARPPRSGGCKDACMTWVGNRG